MPATEGNRAVTCNRRAASADRDLLDLDDEHAENDQRDEHEKADLGGVAHASSSSCGPRRGGTSGCRGPARSGRRPALRTRRSGPGGASRCGRRCGTRGFMSWVMVTMVTRSCSRISMMTVSMAAVVIGSSPVVGSSKSRISGCSAIARANPTRRRMPPESSARHLALDPLQVDQAEALPHPRRDRRLADVAAVATEREGDVLEDGHRVEQRPSWNDMPNLRRISSAACGDAAVRSSPSIDDVPAVRLRSGRSGA